MEGLPFVLVLFSPVLIHWHGASANQITLPGDVVQQDNGNVTSTGYVIRAVNSSYHKPPVLVAWDYMDYAASWVYPEDMTLVNRSQSSNITNNEYRCKVSFAVQKYYISYIKTHLTSGMLLRHTVNSEFLWKGDSCVNLGRTQGMDSNSTRLYCLRLNISLVTNDLANFEIMGVTNYPGVYEYADDNRDLVGNYLYPVVTQYSSRMERYQSFAGATNKATIRVKCGNGKHIDVKVDHSKVGSGDYKRNVATALLVRSELSFTTEWSSTEPGDHYVEFRIMDNDQFKVVTGVWFNIMPPAIHQIEVQGPSSDDRMIYSGSSVTVSQTLTDDFFAFMGYVFYNMTASNHSTPGNTYEPVANFSASLDTAFNMSYAERGVYETFSLSWNKLSIEIIEVSVLVAEVFPVRNLTLTSEQDFAPTNGTLVFILRASEGSGTICTIDYDDGTSEELNANFTQLLDTFTIETDVDEAIKADLGLQGTFQKAYPVPRTYNVMASCINGSQNVSYTKSVLVQRPIDGLSLTALPAHEFGKVIVVSWVMSSGTNVSVSVLYNNISCCSFGPVSDQGGECNCLMTNTSLFDPDGWVSIKIVAHNLVSTANDVIDVEVVEKIVLTGLITRTTTSDYGNEVPGFGDYSTKFPAQHPVGFHANFTGGPAKAATWEITCNHSNGISTGSISCVDLNSFSNMSSCGVIFRERVYFEHTFPEKTDQTCSVELTLSHAVGMTSLSVVTDLDVSFVVRSASNNGPVTVNDTATFTILLDSFGQDTCLTVDLADNSSLLVYGTGSFCQTSINVSDINPNINEQPPMVFTHKNSSTRVITIEHTYKAVGSYDVMYTGANYVSKVTGSSLVVVVEKDCANPNVTIKGLNQNISNITQHYRSERLTRTIEIKLQCKLTQQTKIKWTVAKLAEDPRKCKTPIEGISKTEYKLANDTDLFSAELIIPGKSLDYGFYELTARVEMDGLPDVFGVDTAYVYIVQSPWLKPALTTGALLEVVYGERAVLDASGTVDPDFDGVDGITFQWFCKDMNDTTPFDVSNEPLIYVPQANDPTDPAAIDSTGCFGTGRERLNRTGVILQMETAFMVEGKHFAMTLLASKSHPDFGLRTATTDIYFRVILGLPPELATRCTKNCLSKVNPDEKLILQATCTAKCYGQLSFKWTLFWYDDVDTAEPFDLTTLNEMTTDDLMNMVGNPVNELGMAFKANSLVPGRKYVLQLIARRPNGVYGEQRSTLLMNSSPRDGNCSVYPLSGLSMKTTLNISCKHWQDVDSPLIYEFAYQANQITTVFFSGTGYPGREVISSSVLPIGDTRNDNELKIFVKIKDSLEAATTLYFTVQVDPPGDEVSLTYVSSLVSNDSNQLDSLIKAQAPHTALELAAVMASVINHIHDNDTSGGNQTASERAQREEERHEIDATRRNILNSISKIEVTDIPTLMQMTGALQLVTEKTDELSPQTQDIGVELCSRSVNSLEKLSKEQVPFRSIQSSVTNLVSSVGQLVMAATQDISQQENATKNENGIKRAKQSVSMLDKLHEATLRYLVVNEGPVTISTEYITLQSEKVSLNNLGNSPSEAKNCSFKPPSASVFGFGEIVRDENATISQLEKVTVKMGVFSRNPFTWDNTSKTVTSNIVSIHLGFHNNLTVSNLTEDITISIARDPAQVPEQSTFYMKPDKKDQSAGSDEERFLKYHCFNRTSDWTAMNFELQPEDVGLHMKVYLKTGGMPDLETGDFNLQFELPNFSQCHPEKAVPGIPLNQTGDKETIFIDPYHHCSVHPYSLFISNVDFNQTGEHCFALHVINKMTDNNMADDQTVPSSRRKRSFSCDLGKRRMRRSCVIIPPPPTRPPTQSPIEVLVADNLGFDGKYFFPNQTPNYNLSMFESSCLYWDEQNQTWAGHGCRVGPLTTRSRIQCFCNHLTSFGSDLVVAPNPIDFSSVFRNFASLKDNVAVLALISTVIGLYVTGVIWARRADKRDELMTGPTILPNPQGSYHYLLTIYTGNRQHSGTTARVFFKMNGDQEDTVPVKLWDPDRPCFERAQQNMFIVSYPRAVGELSYVQLWHNNTGSSPSWYLSRLSVKDLQTDQQWYFVCDNWLAVESDDGKVCRVLPLANEQELTSFNQLFTARTVKGLSDSHIWFSIFSRPPSSNFTRVQRLSCCLCLLCCTMITSAMFYNMGGEGPSPYALHIGSMIIDFKQFVIGLESSLVIIPVNVALVQIFRNVRPKEYKKEKNKDRKGEQNKTNDISDESSGKEPSKGKLPHWFLYVGYTLCYLTSAACIFLTLLYSIQWGKKVSTDWVIAMVTAFLQSVLLLQPVKVLLMAVIFAVLIRKPCDSDEEKSDVVAPPETVRKTRRRKTKRTKLYSPPDPGTLHDARIKRLKEIRMNGILKEIAAFFIFLVMLMNVAYYHRDPDTYLMTKTLFETFQEVDAYGVDLSAVTDGDSLWMWARETLLPGLYPLEWYNGQKVEKGYIANMEDYLVGVARVRLLRVEEDSCSVAKHFKDSILRCYNSYSVANEDEESYGVSWQPLTTATSRKRRSVSVPETEEEWLRLMNERSKKRRDINDERQKRALDPVTSDDTEEELLALLTGRSRKIRDNIRQKRALDPIMSANSGRNRRKKKRLLASAKPKTYIIDDNALLPDGKIMSCLERWRHQSARELRGFPYWGAVTVYSGRGYVANLGYDSTTAYTVISDLHSNGWINIQSRAVFVEFTVYNANTNLFGIVSAFVEFPASSAVMTRVQYQVARFYLRLTFEQTLSHIMVIFFIVYFLYREGKLVYKERWAYFKGFWNWVETILVISEFAAIVIFLVRLYEVDRNLLQLRENPNDYVGFQYAGSADAALSYVLGVLVFFYTLRFLRLLRFNKNFLVVGKTISRITLPILNFCLPFFFGFFAFGLFAFSVFGRELEDYSTLIMTMVTQFSTTLGDFDFEALVAVNPVFGPLYFFAFISLNIFILMNMFLAIINDSYADIQEEEQDTQNEYEIVDYVVEKLKSAFNVEQNKTKVVPKKVRRKPTTKPHYVGFKEYQKKSLQLNNETSFSKLESCEKRLSRLLDAIDHGEDSEHVSENSFVEFPEDKRKDPRFRVMLLMESIPFELDKIAQSENEEEEEEKT